MVPSLRDCASLFGHGSHAGEGFCESLEISFEGFDFSFVFGNFRFEDTGTDGVAGGDTGWAKKDGSGTSTINFGSHVFLPSFEFFRLTVGGFSKSFGSGLHGGVNFDKI